MNPEDLKYNTEHTWLRREDGLKGRVGITDFAQRQLKDIVYIELPEAGSEVGYLEPFGVIESVKATNDLYSPVSGRVVEVNGAVTDDPAVVNRDPYGEGWMVVIEMTRPEEVDLLLTAEAYAAAVGG